MQRPLADLVIDVLKDHDAREASFGERTVLDFPFEVAAKTGTSKGFRDNWTAGFGGGLTVAVWVGNFDGEPMNNESGISGAGPLFHAILEAAVARRGAANRGDALPIDTIRHEGLERVQVCALSGELAGESCPHRVSEWRPNGGRGPDDCAPHARTRPRRPDERAARGARLHADRCGRTRVRAVSGGARGVGVPRAGRPGRTPREWVSQVPRRGSGHHD